MNACIEIDPLTKLAIRHGTNKWGHSFYTPIYHSLFSHLHETIVDYAYQLGTASLDEDTLWMAPYLRQFETIMRQNVSLGP